LLTSTGLDKKFEDMSQTSGTPFVSGTKLNSTPTQKKKISLVFFKGIKKLKDINSDKINYSVAMG